MSAENGQTVEAKKGDSDKTQEKVMLKCKNGTSIEVDLELARMSPLLCSILDAPNRKANLPIVIQDEKVSGDVLELVFHQWCRHHLADPRDGLYDDDDAAELIERCRSNPQYLLNPRRPRLFTWISEWEQQLLAGVSNSLLYGMIIATHHLGLSRLMNICCKTVANRLRRMTGDQLKAEFNIANEEDLPVIPSLGEDEDDEDDEIQLLGIDQSWRG